MSPSRAPASASSAAAVDRLSRLLDLYGADYRALSNERVLDAIGRSQSLLIFGAGQNGDLVCRTLQARGLTPAAFIDETPAKIGQSLNGVPIMTLEQAAALPDSIAVNSIFNPNVGHLTIAERLRGNHIASIPLFAFLWAFGDDNLPFYFVDTPDLLIKAAGSLHWLTGRLIDAASLDILCCLIEFRLSLRYEALPPWSADRMDPPQAWSRFQLIDAGAFDGDTLAPMLRVHGARVQRAVALEPDPQTFERLRANVEALGPELAGRTKLMCAAVDRQAGRRMFASAGNPGSSFSEAGVSVDTVSIDSVVDAELEPGVPLFIKYDVEGAEDDALIGSRATILQRRPWLSVAAYHRPHDLWSLAQTISEIDNGYRFMLRSHGADGADLNLYAIPPS